MPETLYLTKSRIRRDLLALFFSNPTKEYYLRELSRLLHCSAGSLRRELLKFEQDGLFETRKAGNLLYYSLNRRHPLFKEIKSIVAKTAGVEGRLRQALSGIAGIKVAFIYGSYASGREKTTSDIDVFVIGEAMLRDLSAPIRQAQKALAREINITLYSEDEYLKRKQEKAGFLEDVLKAPKVMLRGNEHDL